MLQKKETLANGDELQIYKAGQRLYHIVRTQKFWDQQCFVGYEENGLTYPFTTIPYEDLSFARTIKYFTQWGVRSILIQVGDHALPLDHKALRQGVRKALQDTPEPIWCVTATIARERSSRSSGQEARRGTKQFAPGAKVYCFPPLWGDGYEKVKVVGHQRATHRSITTVVRSTQLTNWRAELVYSPQVIFELLWCWDGRDESREKARKLVATIQNRRATIVNFGTP
jgi:hypothetical protein